MLRVKVTMWDFFSVHKDGDKFASCNTCNDRISCEGSSKKSLNATNLIEKSIMKTIPIFSSSL